MHDILAMNVDKHSWA